MKKIMVLSILLSFSITGCNGQQKTDQQAQQHDTIKPDINVSVHKEYDEYGNLISVDSTYTYFYSNIKNDSIKEKDIYQHFRKDFDSQFGTMDSLFMKDFFIESPFRMNDFYTDDFFENHFKLNQQRFEDIFKQMDSLKNDFYKKQKSIDIESDTKRI